MRVLLLLPYAWDTAPGQRFRIEQWVPGLEAMGVEFRVETLLTGAEQRLLYSDGHAGAKVAMLVRHAGRRVAQLRGLRGFDLVWLYRAAFLVGPAVLERVLARSAVPMVVEFDDAIYLPDTSTANARWAGLKCSGKTATICRLSDHVVVGNRYLADYARVHNPAVTVIPTTIDTDAYRPREHYGESRPVVIGWSGSGTTVAHLRTLDRVLQKVAAREDVRLHVVGTDSYPLEGVRTSATRWSPEKERPELGRFDIGVMPLPDEEWARGKCGLKALQYMALGVPTVTSPVGVNSEIIQNGTNGVLASGEDEWVGALTSLIHDVGLRQRLGRAGRATVEDRYSTRSQLRRVFEVMERVSASRRPTSLGTRIHRRVTAQPDRIMICDFARPILRSPCCDGRLEDRDDALVCQECGEPYPVLRGTPRLLRRDLLGRLLPEAVAGAAGALDREAEAKLRTAASFSYEWRRFHRLRDEWERNFLEYMQPRGPEFFAGKRVLDAGCGSGRHAFYAAEFGAEVVAVDLSDAVDVARRNIQAAGRVQTVQADIYDLPFAPASFDFIYSIGVLHHLPDPEGAFRGLLRYLKPGGEIQIYLYWWPEGQPIKRALISGVCALRRVTTRLPHDVLLWLSYPLAAAAFALFVLPYRVLRALPPTRAFAESMPLRQYSGYPFGVCVNDQFDRFSAPIENRYTRDEVLGWLERAGLEGAAVYANWGWLGSGQKPVDSPAPLPPDPANVSVR
jgi:SAM-dependent methyltransferase/glycosyltransferase involved in cell wall biosynthesis/uncharacterized protein YbaR (Trm112 family)